ncbi:LysR substrate-binding domain-containing protein [Marinobacterium arenosum]|uniref:LysR substrate-binding domain-containing protein n=1 Tax=Marinobacterium arenosum TaxID=2862496 RepID=UPI001C983E33|nr:LysR substrate-binding domain-containing protein [Marinobacterium arenosum]MBY4677696.1 LysR family transcriptional regulator [Marinobacterium arenosum]
MAITIKAQTLAALRTFEAAGRLLSFSEAARELCVTTGAVSQQIRKLEEQLGVALFERRVRAIALTPAGEELLGVTRRSLESLSLAVERIQRQTAEAAVRLKAIPSFVFKWLIPRLQAFHSRWPDIRVETFADAALLDIAGGDFDLAIDYGRDGHYPGFESHLLLPETLLPVMAPDYMPHTDWRDPQSWRQAALLHDAMPWPGAPKDAEWRRWLDQSGLSAVDSSCGHSFNRVDMAIEAAAAGLGIALARGAVVREALASGRLVAPLPPVAADCTYYLLIPEGTLASAPARLVADWLLQVASGEEGAAAQL